MRERRVPRIDRHAFKEPILRTPHLDVIAYVVRVCEALDTRDKLLHDWQLCDTMKGCMNRVLHVLVLNAMFDKGMQCLSRHSWVLQTLWKVVWARHLHGFVGFVDDLPVEGSHVLF